jgi:RimJ/RimL family protein N-acetyltransferase
VGAANLGAGCRRVDGFKPLYCLQLTSVSGACVSHIVFESERLRCRRLTSGDVNAMHAVYGDADAMRWVDDGSPLDRAQCAEWIDITQRNYAARGYGMFALELRDSGMVIGFGGLVHPGGQSEAEVKYALRREYWGKGLATEAVCALLDYGARRFRLTRIIATIDPDNVASARVLGKAGLRHESIVHNEDGSRTETFVWHPAAVRQDSP